VLDVATGYQVQVGKAQSLDPDYMGLDGQAVNLSNVDNADLSNSTNVASLNICALTLVKETQLGLFNWEYTFKTELTNSGNTPMGGVSARLTQVPIVVTQWLDDTIVFGAVGPGETAKSDDTVTLRTPIRLLELLYSTGIGYRWTVTVKP
jgi:hypothetical protein